MKILTASALLAALPGSVALTTEYKADRSLRMEIEASLKLEVTKMEVEIDGERRDSQGGGMSSETTRREIHVDHVIEAKDGKPAKIRRSFESVGGKASYAFGENTGEMDLESPLDGVTIEIARDDDGKIDVSAVEGGKPDDKALEGHLPDLFLDALLPDGQVEEGATWELDADAVKKVLRLDVTGALYPPPPREEGGGESGGRRSGPRMGGDGGIWQQLEWTGKAKLAATDEEVDGLVCAVIELELEASGDIPDPEPRQRQRGQAYELASPAFETTYEVSLEGKLVFAVKEKRPVSLELEGKASIDSQSEGTRNERTFKRHSVQEGEVTYKVTVTEESGKGK